MDVGEHYAYRVKYSGPLVEVELLKIGTQKPARVQVRFVEESAEGRIDWVPPNRLKVPWFAVDAFRSLEAKWDALLAAGEDEDTPSYWAASEVIDSLVESEVAETQYRSNGGLRIRNASKLAAALDWPESDLLLEPSSFQEGSDWLVPQPMTGAIAKRLCQLNPEAVLALVERDQEKADRDSTYGTYWKASKHWEEHHTPAEWHAEYDAKEPNGRAKRELLREWCGQQAVSHRDELQALRAEVRRLGSITERAITRLRAHGDKHSADELERELGIPVETFRGQRD